MFEQWLTNPVQYLFGAVLFVLVLLLIILLYRRRAGAGSLGNQLLLNFMAVAAFSLALVVGAVVWRTQQILTRQTGETFQALAQSNSQRLTEGLIREVELLQNLSEEVSLFYIVYSANRDDLAEFSDHTRELQLKAREATWAAGNNPILRPQIESNLATSDLRNFVNTFPAHSEVAYINEFGALVAFGGDVPEHYYYGDEEWWQRSWNGNKARVVIGNLQFTPGQPDATIDIVVPVQVATREESWGVIRSRFKLQSLSVFADPLFNSGEGESSLVDSQGVIFYSNRESQIGAVIPEIFQKHIAMIDVGWAVNPDQNGRDIIHSHASIIPYSTHPFLEELGWAFIIQQPASSALTIVAQISQLAFGVGLVAFLLAIGLGLVVAQRISRPIRELTETASAIAQGQLERTTKVSGPNEIRTMATVFNSMTLQLRQTLSELENRVAARTRRLEIIASLGERLSAILEVDILLEEVVNQIKDDFGYYHAHIYLFDKDGEKLVVAAGTGLAGAEMKAKGHNIALAAETSLVARAARTKEVVNISNVRETADWLPNPLLPDTFSEMAVPIILEEKVVGVLDVQQNKIAGLDEGDATLLRSVANQVAVAVRNARLFEEVESNLTEAREIQRKYILDSWEPNLAAKHGAGQVKFSLGESTTLSDEAVIEARHQALIQQQPAIVSLKGSQPGSVSNKNLYDDEAGTIEETSVELGHALVAPIILRGVPIGNLQLHDIGPNRDLSEGELALIEAVIVQIAQTAENLRLIDEAQERAGREQLIGQISDRLRRASDIESLMKIAVEEIAGVLKPARTFVKFGSTEKLALPSDKGLPPTTSNGHGDNGHD